MKEKRTAGHKDTRDIWEICSTVISNKTFRVWGALENFLQKYNLLLTERARAIQVGNYYYYFGGDVCAWEMVVWGTQVCDCVCVILCRGGGL